MTKHVGVSIGCNDLRAIWVEAGVLRWHAFAPLAAPNALDKSLAALLSSAPRALAHARVTVVLSPRWVQTRQIYGFPPITSPRVAAQLLSQNEPAFFLWNGSPSTVVAHIARDGAAWGAAFDTEFLHGALFAARSVGLRIDRIAPSVVALGAAFRGRGIVWRDGEHAFQLRGTLDGLIELRRIFDDRIANEAPMPDLLRPIGADAEQYLAAYAAAVVRRKLPLDWRPGADPTRRRHRARLINATGAIALVGSAAAAVFAPGLRAARAVRASERDLRRLHSVQMELSAEQSELRRVSEALDRIHAFADDRGRVTRMLGDLSAATPDSTAIIEIRLDSAEGTFTAVAPSVADVLPALADVGGIVAPQIAGAVMRETVAGVRLERASFRFRRPRAAKGHVP